MQISNINQEIESFNMPTYEYKCNSCNHVFEAIVPMAKRKTPTRSSCDICGKKQVKQVILTCPNMGMDSCHDIHKASGGFKSAMQRVCESPGIKNSKRASELKDRYNL